MHSSFEMKAELRLRKELGLDNLATGEPWPKYYEKVVHDGYFPTAVQDEIAKKCHAEWVARCATAPTVVVHDDLHTENMMLNDDNWLIGILDFGDTNVGTPEQELR
jgi:Ser/Thr protein kinase RdoA (MazF antagonist)